MNEPPLPVLQYAHQWADWHPRRPDSWQEAIALWVLLAPHQWRIGFPKYMDRTERVPEEQRRPRFVQCFLEWFPQSPPDDHSPDDMAYNIRRHPWVTRESAEGLVLLWHPNAAWSPYLRKARLGAQRVYATSRSYEDAVGCIANQLKWPEAKVARMLMSYSEHWKERVG